MKKYYIQMFSPHGLIRYQDPEIGGDKDTGGQVKYVLELLEALSKHEKVRKVDLFTRLIKDKRVDASYANDIELVNEKARIVRIPCGGTRYRKKEKLWSYLDEFIEKTIRFNKDQDDIPDLVHGHYADGNYIAQRISEFFRIPFFFTGHSLGRNKKDILLEQGMLPEKINEVFNIERRIDVEEEAISKADVIITSTQHEIDTQYQSYHSFQEGNFKVIPPGISSDVFFPFYRHIMPSFEMSIEQEQTLYGITAEIERFFFDPNKPLILSIGRPDKRKNFETIIEMYGTDKELQTVANLAIFAGVRKDISKMPHEEQEILTNLLLLLDKYDLYGKLALPKKNDPKLEIPEIYRLAARKKGVFINATPGENFGFTVVEAAACGLPVIAASSGGPKEILKNCKNGILVDVNETQNLADAVKKIIGNGTTWESYSSNGIKGIHEHYLWEKHVDLYIKAIEELNKKSATNVLEKQMTPIERRLSKANSFIISDLDGTLITEEEEYSSNSFKQWYEARKDEIVFGIATGRNKELTKEALKQFDLPSPDILICSAGSELYYTEEFIPDSGWETHISYEWNRENLEQLLNKFPKLQLQEPEAQWKFKLSYYVDDDFNDDNLAALNKFLDDHNIKANILLTDNKFLDFLPLRASKGNVLKYLSSKWKSPLEQFITAGNGGNDYDMLKGETKGIVVANYSPELESLRKHKDIYFSGTPLAEGVLEGIQYYAELNGK